MSAATLKASWVKVHEAHCKRMGRVKTLAIMHIGLQWQVLQLLVLGGCLETVALSLLHVILGRDQYATCLGF